MALTQAQKEFTFQKDKENGLPKGTTYAMMGIESGWNGNKKSSAGAEGWMQFMPDGKKTGYVRQKYGIKDPYNFEQAVSGAARYMGDLLKQYGDMSSALAAYNGGGAAVKAWNAGKPWAATSDYINKFSSGKYHPNGVSSMGGTIKPTAVDSHVGVMEENAFKNVPAVDPSVATAQTRLDYYDDLPFHRQVWEATKSQFITNNNIYNWFNTEGMKEYDPDFAWNEERKKQFLEGIPEAQQGYILKAMSEQEALRRREAVQEHLWEQQKLGAMGVLPSLMGGLLESFAEPETYLFMLPIFNGGALAYQSSRIGRMLLGATTGSLQNVGVDALTGGYKPSYSSDDLYMSALFGAMFGSLGGIAKPHAPIKPLVKPQAKEIDLATTKYFSREVISKMKKMGYVIPENWKVAPKAPDINQLHTVVRQAFAPTDYSKMPSKVMDNLRAETDSILRQLGADRARLQRETIQLKSKNMELDYEINKALNKHYDFSDRKVNWDKPINGGVLPSNKQVIEIPYEKNFRTYDPNNVVGLKRTFKGGVVRESVSTIAELKKLAETTKHKEHKVLAERLLEHLGDNDLPLWYTSQKDLGSGTWGTYWHDHSIAIYKTARGGADESTLLHEVEHALTVRKIEYGLANPNSEHGQLVTELQKCYDIAMAEARKRYGWSEAKAKDKFYGLKNLKEFVSTLTEFDRKDRKEWHDFLSSIKLSNDESIWSKFLDTMKKLMGFKDDEFNLYLKSLGIADEISAKKTKVTDKKGTVRMMTDIPEGHVRETESAATQDPDILAKAEASAAPTSETLSPIDTVDMLEKEVKTEGWDIFGLGLDLQHILNGKDTPDSVKGISKALIGTNVGTKTHGIVRESAGEMKTRLTETITTKANRKIYAAWQEYLSNNNVKMRDKAQAEIAFNDAVDACIRGIDGNYPEEVERAAKAIREAYGEMRKYINNPEWEIGTKKKGLTEYEFKDPDSGEVFRIGELPENPNYAPRKYQAHKISALADDIGRDGIIQYFQGAYMAHNPNVTDEFAKRWAEWHVNTLERVHINNIHNDVSMGMEGFNFVALKESLMMNGFNEKEANQVIRSMTNFSNSSPQSRLNSNLKYRSPFDEKFTMDIMGKNGELRTVGIQDMIDTHATSVMQGYVSRMSGAVAMARHMNVYKDADWESMISHALREQLGNSKLTPAKKAKLEKHLRFAKDRIMDVPLNEFSPLSKGLNMFGKYNVIRLMGQAVFNQVVELSNILGTTGFKGTVESVGELGRIIRDAKTGKLNNEFLAGIEDMMGSSGLEFSRQMNYVHNDWVQNMGNTAMNRFLDKVDGFLDRGSSNVLHYSGMTPLTTYQQKLFNMSYFNRLMDIAHGIGDRKYFSQDRLHWMGLSEGDFQNILGDMRKYTTKKRGENGAKTHMLDFDRWLKESPENYHKLAVAARRESRRVIQENDLASMIPIMGTTLGQTMFQFMNFSMQAWSKSMLFGLHHRDSSTLATVLYGGTLACLTYVARTYGQAANMKDDERKKFLEERLSIQQIVANSFGRIQQASILPTLFDTISPVPFFSGMRTTSDVTSIASMPSIQLINSLIGMKKLAVNALSDEQQTTRRDVRAMLRILPLNNTIPSMWLLNNWVNSFPTSEKEK